MNLTEKFLHGQRVFKGKLLEVHRDIVTMPDCHEEVREIVRHPGAAMIIPHLGDNRYVLVQQFRYALNKVTIEFPAGRLEPGEDPVKCARRELAEETGYRAQILDFLFVIHPAPGYADEIIYVYTADQLEPGQSNPDPDEVVLTEEKTIDELFDLFRTGEITDSKTANALLYLKCCNSP